MRSRNAFFIYCALIAAVWIAGLPFSWARLQTPCIASTGCVSVQMRQAEFSQFVASGASLPFYATFMTTIIFILDTLIGSVMAILLVARRPGDRMALLLAIPMVGHAFNFMGNPAILRENYPWLWPITLLPLVAINAFWLPAFSLLPDGRWVPRWSRWLVPYAVALGLYAYLGHLFLPKETWESIVATAFMVNFTVLTIFQSWRYFKSSPSERIRVKWVLTGIVISFSALAFFGGLEKLFPNFFRPGSIPWFIHKPFSVSSPILMYICIWIAVLRYKLFDIDLIIRRTLVYSLLTGLLGAVYFGSVTLLQAILTASSVEYNGGLPTSSAVGGRPSAVVLVLTTLLIAALFNPLRKRLQDTIDRRFYRQKYDAEKALAEFAAVTRSETSLPTLSQSLVGVVQNTVQPEEVKLWLKS